MKLVSSTLVSVILGTAAASLLFSGSAGAQTLFYDDFSGPTLNSAWRTYLPSAAITTSPAVTYQGAPGSYSFQTLGGASVLRMTDYLGDYQRAGWSTTSAFTTSSFRYETRFNTLNQSGSTSIDAFFELWIFDPANPAHYDKVCPFGADYSGNREFISSSGIDNSASVLSFNYQNNTWYRLVLSCAPGQNIRVALDDDNGNELIGRTLNHGAGAYASGFDLAISQAIGAPTSGRGPSDVAIDWVQLTQVPEPGSGSLLACALAGGWLWNRVRRGRAGTSH